MAFTPKTWVDRAVEFAGRRLLIAVSGLANGFDVSRSEGTVFVAGDEIDATNLNDLETRISNEFGLINTALGGYKISVLTVAAYTALGTKDANTLYFTY